MILAHPNLSALLGDLTLILDEQIELVEQRLAHMHRLAGTILSRDEKAMEQLLGEMEQAQQTQALADVKLSAIRHNLARAAGLPPKDVSLSGLLPRLSSGQAAPIRRRRELILQLTGELRKQHLSTAILLCECSRVNRLMLDALLGGPQSVGTYQSDGTQSYTSGHGLVDAER